MKIPKRIFILGKERVAEVEKLEGLLKRYPTVKEFYEVKERLREMYKCKSRESAEEKLSSAIGIAERNEEVGSNL